MEVSWAFSQVGPFNFFYEIVQRVNHYDGFGLNKIFKKSRCSGINFTPYFSSTASNRITLTEAPEKCRNLIKFGHKPVRT